MVQTAITAPVVQSVVGRLKPGQAVITTPVVQSVAERLKPEQCITKQPTAFFGGGHLVQFKES